MQKLRGLINHFVHNTRGNITIIAGLSAVPLVLAAGTAVDFVNASKYVSESQSATDAAALTGAMTKKSVSPLGQLLGGDDAKKEAVAKMLEANLPDKIKKSPHSSEVTIDGNKIKVDLTVAMQTAFMRVVGIDNVNVHVSSTALRYDGRACLIALGADGKGINLGGSSNVLAPSCWAYSNKTGSNSVYVGGSSKLTTAGTCAVGSVNLANYGSATPPPKKCYPLSDPMEKWAPPPTSWTCDHNNFKKTANAGNKTITLSAGVYCGGLKATGYDSVTLEKGIYFIKDGAVDITSKLTLTGTKVGFYLSKDVSGLTINGNATVNLTADDQGPMAGLLIAMEKGGTSTITASITGTSSLYLQGSIYMPTADIALAGTSATTMSPVTQIIGNSIELQGTSNLTFKADFETAGYAIRGPDAQVLLTE
jgi:Flp pilus assembly protein TadG